MACRNLEKGEAARQLAYHVLTFSTKGLETVESVRFWPGGQGEAGHFERVSLPEPVTGE